MPDLTPYQIHERIMDSIAINSPKVMPSGVIVDEEWSKTSGIPEGAYARSPEGIWVRSGDLPKSVKADYCCEMRRHFILGIIATRGPEPTEIADFAIAWEPKILVAPVYCGWCGEKYRENSTRRVTGI
mgnify:CR=1 FL=1